jgi:prepilin-type N-terminal cleavage/methylation domain-containing protein
MNTFSIESGSALMPVMQLKRKSRKGFSIIEVLAAIAVALVGVLGVMILVPYAVKMSTAGLDLDSALSLRRNSFNQFLIEGFRNVNRWGLLDDGRPITVDSRWRDGRIPFTPFSIDPMAITGQPSGTPDYSIARTGFPFVPDFPYRIPPVNLLHREPVDPDDPDTFFPFDRAAAERMCLMRDDLVFSSSENATPDGGPVQVFDTDTIQGNSLRRQFEGKFSWSALAFPQDSGLVHSYRLYFLVYKQRVFFDRDDPNTWMAYAEVVPPRTPNLPGLFVPPVSGIQLDRLIDESLVRRDDWVMLVNQRQDAQARGNAFDWQVGFYRVISLSGNYLSLGDGPSFDFNTERYGTTYAVHLKGVVDVTERRIVNENQSMWN